MEPNFKTSEDIIEIAKALAVFQMTIGKIKKDATNPFFNHPYATLSTILEAIAGPLQESSLVVSQFPTGNHGLTTLILHTESGQWFQSEYSMKPTREDPQGHGSAITYMRRYALGAALCLNIEEDDDANQASRSNGKIETDARPSMTQQQFEKCVARIENGEKGVYEKAAKAMRMKKEYERKLRSIS